MLRISIATAFCLSAIFSAGCGDAASGGAKVKTVPFSGKVTIDGKPAGKMGIQFLPKGSDGGVRTSYADVSETGDFSATTYITGDGIVPGEYTVKAGGGEGDGASTDPAKMMAAAAGMSIESVDIKVPAEGLTDVEIKLTSKNKGKKSGGAAVLGY